MSPHIQSRLCTALGSEFLINATTAGLQTLPAVAAEGSFVIAWQGSGVPDPLGVYVRKVAADGTPARNKQ